MSAVFRPLLFGCCVSLRLGICLRAIGFGWSLLALAFACFRCVVSCIGCVW